MSDPASNPPRDDARGSSNSNDSAGGNSASGGGDSAPFSERFHHQPVGARVPERLKHGVLSTGVVVLDSPKEIVLDFLLALARPHAIVARVVMTPSTLDEMIAAMQENIANYTRVFGPPPALPKIQNPRRPSIAELYENFKLPDESLSGCYANSVMMGHTAAEFFLDFITTFYPTAAVSSRVFLAAAQAPRVLDTLILAAQNYRARHLPPPGRPGPGQASPPPENPGQGMQSGG